MFQLLEEYEEALKIYKERRLRGESHSDFWMPKNNRAHIDTTDGLNKVMKLERYRRTISNFVNVLTGKRIPVIFKTGDESYTTGNFVVLSADIHDDNLDSTVGLACHEGTHISHSDFDIIQKLAGTFDIKRNDGKTEEEHNKIRKNYYKHIPLNIIPQNLIDLVKTKKRTVTHKKKEVIVDSDDTARIYIQPILKRILNYLEDKRIDDLTYKSSPGYRPYYIALYERYGFCSSSSKDMKSLNEFMKLKNIKKLPETWHWYRFMMWSQLNPNLNISALKSLKKVIKLCNLSNIDRLKNTQDVLELSWKIFEIIEKSVDNKNLDFDDDFWAFLSGVPKDLLNKLKELFNKFEKTLDGGDDDEIEPITQSEANSMNAVCKSNIDYKKVGTNDIGETDVVVVRNLNKDLILSDIFRICRNTIYNDSQEAISEGILLANTLAKRLMIRGENRTLKSTRNSAGRIDRRLLSEIGTGNSNIFYKLEKDLYNDVSFHISIDASSSMSGDTWIKALSSAIAIAKVCNEMKGLRIQISFRTTHNVDNDNKPLMVLAYDSNDDKFSKIINLFKYIRPCGTTPEGLCFQSIMDVIPKPSKTHDSYFINYSDGMPLFSSNEISSYNTTSGAKHTAEQVREILKSGIEVISYFVTDGDYDTYKDTFINMYGTNASFVEPIDMPMVAKSLNERFLKKRTYIS